MAAARTELLTMDLPKLRLIAAPLASQQNLLRGKGSLLD